MSDKELQLQFVQEILNAQPEENELYVEFHRLVDHDFVDYADENSTYHKKSSSLMRLQEICRQLELVVSDPQFHQKGQVAVAGCFSSGKSAFINSFFQQEGVRLPIDSTPTTSIASYVVDGPPAITGFAYNGGRVAISPQLFRMFRHGQEDGFEFNVKKIVSRIVVSTPWSQSFPHICLVDTPGFDNGGQERDSDDSAALASIATADGVVWCVSVERGTLPDKDCELLLQLRDLNPRLRLFLVLTQADKKSLEECEDILLEVADILEAEGIETEGICLYSSSPRVVGSQKESLRSRGRGKGLEDFLRGIPPRSKERLLEPIQEVFRGYREADKVRVAALVEQRKDLTIIGNLHYAKVDELKATVSRQKARLAALGDDEVEKREKKVVADSTADTVWQSPSEPLAAWRRKLAEEIAIHERDMQAADALQGRMTRLVERIFGGDSRVCPSFNPARPDCDAGSAPAKTVMRAMVETMAKGVETKKPACDQGQQGWRIGERGPGGGIVFHIDGPKVYEVSEVLGKYTWEKAKKVAEGYRGGGFSDWRLPTREELNLVYQNLRKPRIITGDDRHWSSSQHGLSYYWAQRFDYGGQVYGSVAKEFSVRAIRAF